MENLKRDTAPTLEQPEKIVDVNNSPEHVYTIDGYKIVIKDRNIINEDPGDDFIKDTIKFCANFSDIEVYNTDGVLLGYKEFNDLRRELWTPEKSKELKENNQELVITTFTHNKFGRLHQLEGLLKEMLMDYPKHLEWENKLNEIKKIEDIQEQTKVLDGLLVEIYKEI